MPPIDLQALQAAAGQLLGQDGSNAPVTSFDVGKLFEGVQQQLLDALSLAETQEAPAEPGDEDVDVPSEREPEPGKS